MKIYLALLLAGLSIQAAGQQTITINRTYRPANEEESEMVFLYYPYRSNILDLSHFRDVFPASKLELQEKIVILPPDLSQMSDTVYGITYFPPVKNRPGKMVILIIGNFKTPSPVYFIDYNLDRNYANDGPPYIFGEENFTTLTFENTQDRSHPYILRLLNPREQREIQPDEVKTYRREQQTLRKQQRQTDYDAYQRYMLQAADNMRESSHLGIRILSNVSFGGIRYNYKNGQTGYPTNYQVDFNTKGLSTQVTYRFGGFKLGAIGRYENIFYWSSTKKTREGDPFYACDDQGICKWYNNVRYDFNLEILPRNRFSYGLSAEYGFRISTYTFIHPYFTAMGHVYTGEGFIPSRYQDPHQSYDLGPGITYEAGIMLISDLSRSMSFIAAIHATNTGFKPQGYFDQFDPQELYKTNQQAGVSLGFQLRVE
ncbi:MAG: hypothetical protein SF052_00515 [Bacteroidia bacterium]|nr:hypothetical protein [Bacteroidia bacterium]